jgi:hypothetical protein
LQELPPLGVEERLAWIPELDGVGVLRTVTALARWRQVAWDVKAAPAQRYDMLKGELAACTAKTANTAKQHVAPTEDRACHWLARINSAM